MKKISNFFRSSSRPKQDCNEKKENNTQSAEHQDTHSLSTKMTGNIKKIGNSTKNVFIKSRKALSLIPKKNGCSRQRRCGQV